MYLKNTCTTNATDSAYLLIYTCFLNILNSSYLSNITMRNSYVSELYIAQAFSKGPREQILPFVRQCLNLKYFSGIKITIKSL